MHRLSMNQMTVRSLSVPELLAACRRHEVPAVGLWREPVQTHGVTRTAREVRESGLEVSSLCRGGFLTNPANQSEALADNRRAIDEAAELGAQSLVLVVGGLFDRDLRAARTRVADAVAELAPYAAERDVVLALEPMHPVFCADRGVLSTLKQALDMVEAIGSPAVRVVVDTVHVWWDPEVEAQIARAGERIALYQVCDWITPLPADVLAGRGIPGQGHIDFGYLGRCVAAAGYAGVAEVEVFHEEVWAADPDEVFARVVAAHRELVLPGLTAG
ncbi:sugar phosphate isomerase/epimerase family protein [Crossiella sp. NPDC003009]